MKLSYSAILNLAAGICLAFAYPHIWGNGFFPLSILAFSFYYSQLLDSTRIKNMLVQTFMFCLGFSAVGFYWIPQTLSTFGGMQLYLGQIISIFFALIVLPYLWPQVFLIYYLKKIKLPLKTILIILCCSHVFLEQITPSQFPVWLGHSLLTTQTLLPLASYFGAGIYSFALMLIILFVPYVLKKNFQYVKPILLGMGIVLFDFVLGINTKYMHSLKDSSENYLNVRIVQANIGNFMKISSEFGDKDSVQAVYDQYEKYSFQNPQNYDLLIWPETAVPSLFDTTDWNHDKINYFPHMQKIIFYLPPKAGFVFGGYDEGNLDQSQNNAHNEFNTAFFYQNQNLETYYKIKLIPFGETLPFGNYNRELSKFFPGVSLFSQGSRYNSFTINQKFHFITPICYELLDTDFMRTFLNSSEKIDFIVNLTNDSWYGNTAQPWQHLFLARWRALEFRKPIIRSTNTGITTIIDELGQFSKYLNINETNILEVKLNIHSKESTFYQRHGKSPLNLMLLLILIYFVSPALIKSWRRKTPNNS